MSYYLLHTAAEAGRDAKVLNIIARAVLSAGAPLAWLERTRPHRRSWQLVVCAQLCCSRSATVSPSDGLAEVQEKQALRNSIDVRMKYDSNWKTMQHSREAGTAEL